MLTLCKCNHLLTCFFFFKNKVLLSTVLNLNSRWHLHWNLKQWLNCFWSSRFNRCISWNFIRIQHVDRIVLNLTTFWKTGPRLICSWIEITVLVHHHLLIKVVNDFGYCCTRAEGSSELFWSKFVRCPSSLLSLSLSSLS